MHKKLIRQPPVFGHIAQSDTLIQRVLKCLLNMMTLIGKKNWII